jgi:hypothetical protein
MNLAKPTEVPQPDSRQEYSPISTQAVLFAVLQDFVSTTKSTAGYIDIIRDNPHDTLAIKRLALVNKQQTNTTCLIDIFYRLSSLGAAHPKSMPIEKLFTNIAANSSIRIAASSSNHSSAMVSTDEDVLAWCIVAIVSACGTSKVLKYRSRKRGKYLVLSIYSRKKTWLTPRLVDLIRGFKPTHLASKKQRLDELLASYALFTLSQLDVAVSIKKTPEQEGLCLHLPVSQQLNVFEASEYLR